MDPYILQCFVLLPLVSFLISLFLPKSSEKLLSGLAQTTVGVYVVGVVGMIIYWVANGCKSIEYRHLTIYKSPTFEFFTVYYFDAVTAIFALVGGISIFFVARFSQFYMHRDTGFKRFFTALLLFFTGYNLVIFSGNFETLFLGWELLGITSFLLIAFYRDRYLPVRNAYKVLSFYRLGDILLVLAMWMSHHLWHKNIMFSEWTTTSVQAIFETQPGQAMFLCVMIIVAAIIKSAQMPFSTWLTRAMEGPTTSSAIFYGALAVHIGAFLLLRTAPLWSEQWVLKALIFVVGLVTAIGASGIASVQSTVKTQIAYASIAQIGLIFIEISLGWYVLSLVHFTGNAFLRSYQLLVSPSVLSYLVHDMFFSFQQAKPESKDTLWQKLSQAIYMLNIKEWNLDRLLHSIFWRPFKFIGASMRFLSSNLGEIALLCVACTAGVSLVFQDESSFTKSSFVALLCAIFALLLVLKAFAERGNAFRALLAIFISQVLMVVSISWNANIVWQELLYYMSGSTIAAVVGFICLQILKTKEAELNLNDYHGHAYEHRALALVFLLSCLAYSGFPITPTFIGIDLMFTYINKNQPILLLFWSLHFLFLELALIRLYARIFMGPHKKEYHPIAFKYS